MLLTDHGLMFSVPGPIRGASKRMNEPCPQSGLPNFA